MSKEDTLNELIEEKVVKTLRRLPLVKQQKHYHNGPIGYGSNC
jgi:hypothetical protein